MLKQTQWRLIPPRKVQAVGSIHFRINGQPQTLCGRMVPYGRLIQSPDGTWCRICKQKARSEHAAELAAFENGEPK